MLQTNAYVCYCKYMKMHDKSVMSHLEFCKQIAIAWLDPHNSWPRLKVVISTRRQNSEARSIASSVSTGMVTRSLSSKQEKKKRARRFTDGSLDPTKGSLSDRLHQVQHWPLMDGVLDSASCQLHRWASGGGKRRRGQNLFKCSYCEVTLCERCFLTYHTVVDLLAVKKQLAIEDGGLTDEQHL